MEDREIQNKPGKKTVNGGWVLLLFGLLFLGVIALGILGI